MNRLFRADTCHDVLSASIVATGLPPGRNILALCTDKSHAETAEYEKALRAGATGGEWNTVVDLTGIPANSRRNQLAGPIHRLKCTRASVRYMRKRIAEALDIHASERLLARELDGAVNELYVNCLHHEDVRSMWRLFPTARKCFYPHGFGSLDEPEVRLNYNSVINTNKTLHTKILNSIIDFGKIILGGLDAVPIRQVNIDAAYTFNRPAPWARSQQFIGTKLNRETADQLFARFPLEVQQYYRDLAAECGPRTAVLLLVPEVGHPEYPLALEHDCYAQGVRHLTREFGAITLLVKPHPRSSREHAQAAVAALQRSVPTCRAVVVKDYASYPIEVCATVFDLIACLGVGSSALYGMKAIYGVNAYCPEEMLLRLYSFDLYLEKSFRIWVEGNRQYYTPV